MPESGEVTRLLESWGGGDSSALERLVPLVYRELRRIAASYIRRERVGHTLQPTALLHEAYVRLIDQQVPNCTSRAQFFGIAANLMRQILVNHAKRRSALKRGGTKVSVTVGTAAQTPAVALELVALDAALDRLARREPRLSRVVELRFFAGLTEAEIADVLDVSTVTVKRDWRLARAVLQKDLGSGA